MVHIGGFNQRQGEALPPQIFLTLTFGSVYFQENYQNCCQLMSDFKAKKAPNSISARAPPQTPLGELAALTQAPADPIPALGPPDLETTCIPKYVSLNPSMMVQTLPSEVFHSLTSLSVVNINHRRSQGVQWVHLHPQGGEKNFCQA